MECGEGEHAEPVVDLRVLILDDVAPRRERLLRHLTSCGYHVTPVCHPRQALEAASFRRFDAVVFSRTLPEFDCTTLVGKLRHLLGRLRFIVLSDGDGDDVDECDMVRVSLTERLELEQAVEQLLAELAAARSRQRGIFSESEELLGIA
jgi:PleD family two-component response regulator